MSNFYIQSGYQGKEVSSLLFNYPKESFSYSKIEEWRGQPIVGSVEFVEQYIGQKTPNYYPEFLSGYFKRIIWTAESLNGLWCDSFLFIKPADKHKRFESKRLDGFGSENMMEKYEWEIGPYWCSEIVSFKEEWRYYVANGEVLAAHWYQGKEEEIEAPFSFLRLIDWPEDFCGAVDFGRLDNGEIALVENNLPYACGFYGPSSEGKIYGEWLQKSWNYALNCR